ncbi:hypothetical protein [Nocardia sp. NPDC058480]|uniref:hypothetical protein n=1 Tax=unclassified Nocardia TaxID=2637762 RepID=UPI0036603954
MTSESNSGHANGGPSTEDEITRDTGRALGQIMAAARAFIASHSGRQGKTKMPKLSRKERRELVETLRTQVGEQRMAQAWSTKRVNDYHAEVLAEQERRQSPGYTSDQAEVDHQRLARIRYAIEAGAHASPLSFEQRGQVSQALSQVQAHPSRPLGAVFKPMDADEARNARAAAVRSETWVQGRREANERVLVAQRNREQARLNARPPLAWEDMNPVQQDAVQQLRGAELALRRVGTADAVTMARRDREMRAAAREVRAAGLPLRQVAHERDNIVANSKYEVTVYAGWEPSSSWHPSETVALAHAESAVARVPATTESVGVQVAPRYGQDPGGNTRSVHGDHMFASQAVSWWRGDHEIEVESGTTRAGHRTEISIAGTDPVTGREVRAERVLVRTDEHGALQYADRTIECAEWNAGERVELDIDDAEVDWEYPGSTSLYRMSGTPAGVQNRALNEQVTLWHREVEESRSAAARVAGDRDSLRQRHNLSIEHNGDLTDRNAELTRQLSALTAERDQALADRDKFRGERDQAVQKVASMTPAKERFGSAARQASTTPTAAAKGTNTESNKKIDEVMALLAGRGALDGALATIGVSEETRARVRDAVFTHDRLVDAGLADPVGAETTSVTKSPRPEQKEVDRPTKSAAEVGTPVNAFNNASTSVNAFAPETERDGHER